ncbi:MAG: hypothetical protein ABL998_14470 [Planctomycetota bacterium]
MSLRRFVLVLPLALLASLAPAFAQEPKLGNKWYEDAVDLGFKFRAPKDWSFVPGQPGEQNMVGKYAPARGQEVHLGKDAVLEHAIYVLKFDRRPEANQAEKKVIGDREVEVTFRGLKNIEEWMSKGIDEGTAWRRVEGPKAIKEPCEGSISVFEGMSTTSYGSEAEPQPVRAHVTLLKLGPDVELALVGTGPGDKKKWRDFESAYWGVAKTMQRVTVAASAPSASSGGKDPRSLKRAKLEKEVAKSPGWSLHETPNYFIMACTEDKALVEDLKVRLEAIRQIYVRDYPPELSRKIKVVESLDEEEGEEGEEGEDGGDGEDGEPGQDGEPGEDGQDGEPGADAGDDARSIATIDALELGKLSVVRLCKNEEMYYQYGGPRGTSGYFSSFQAELLIYDDKADRGRDYTWAVLNHEGFHQYIFSFFGNVSPQSWYNEGTGDYYSGFDFNTKTKKFTPKKNQGRQDNVLRIKDNLVPLQRLVTLTQAEFYNPSEFRLEGWATYAQGWSLIWFLREGKGKAKGWQKPWEMILDTYLETLLATGKTKVAVEKAFEGVDWKALETSWKDFIGL